MRPSKVGCIVFLGQVVGRKSVTGPEHHAPQVVGADSLGRDRKFNDDGFAGLVCLHEAAGDTLLQLHLTPGKGTAATHCLSFLCRSKLVPGKTH